MTVAGVRNATPGIADAGAILVPEHVAKVAFVSITDDLDPGRLVLERSLLLRPFERLPFLG
jgi:hypothetical protein